MTSIEQKITELGRGIAALNAEIDHYRLERESSRRAQRRLVSLLMPWTGATPERSD